VNDFLSVSHLVALSLALGLGVTIVPLAHRRPGPWVFVTSVILGIFLVVQELAYEATLLVTGHFSLQYSLPLYLCDVAAVVAGIALIWPQRRLVELTWFWALAGTLQGLLTPDVSLDFPSWSWLQYYGDHAGVVLAAMLLVVGRGLHPRPGAAPRAFFVTVLFTALVGVADLFTGGNYMYLRQVPGGGSLLSLFGPWPVYIGVAAIVAVIFIVASDAPFWPERRRASLSASPRGSAPVRQ